MLRLISELALLVFGATITYCFLDMRFSNKKCISIFAVFLSVVVLLNGFVILSYGIQIFYRVYPITVHVPIFCCFLIISKSKALKVLFCMLTAVVFCFPGAILRFIISHSFVHNNTLCCFICILSYIPTGIIVIKYFRPIYKNIIDNEDIKWGLVSSIPLLYYALLYTSVMFDINKDSLRQVAIINILALALMLVTYVIILISFNQVQEKLKIKNEQNILKTQVLALQIYSDRVAQSEEKIKIYRHDFRHYIQPLMAVLQSGDIIAGIELLSNYADVIEQTKILKYCENYIINAVLSYILENAKKQGIEIKSKLDIPKSLPVDEIELAVVLLNAIENAVNACNMLPESKQKFIKLTSKVKPQFVFEIANTYNGSVTFDKNGLPTTDREEHGIGTRSICEFVKKNNATIAYNANESIFKVQVILRDLMA